MSSTRQRVEGRRVRAAVAYSNLRLRELAEQLGSSERTIQRWGNVGLPTPAQRITPALAEACDLPEASFYADFTRLREIVPPSAPARVAPPPIDRAETERLIRELERRAAQYDAEHSQTVRPDPNGHQAAG
jgi:transcriptional regulator with XRE-family HTH domain